MYDLTIERNGRTGKLIGTLTVPEGVKRRQLFECAAWHIDHALIAGTYPVYRFEYSGDRLADGRWIAYTYDVADVPSVVEDACFRTLFGGVGYGDDTRGRERIGQRDSYAIKSASGPTYLDCLKDSNTLEGCAARMPGFAFAPVTEGAL